MYNWICYQPIGRHTFFHSPSLLHRCRFLLLLLTPAISRTSAGNMRYETGWHCLPVLPLFQIGFAGMFGAHTQSHTHTHTHMHGPLRMNPFLPSPIQSGPEFVCWMGPAPSRALTVRWNVLNYRLNIPNLILAVRFKCQSSVTTFNQLNSSNPSRWIEMNGWMRGPAAGSHWWFLIESRDMDERQWLANGPGDALALMARLAYRLIHLFPIWHLHSTIRFPLILFLDWKYVSLAGWSG